MRDKEFKVLNVWWYNGLNVWWYNGAIGIVKVDTGFEIKYYIGTAYGQDEKEDIEKILKHGSRLYPEIFEVKE